MCVCASIYSKYGSNIALWKLRTRIFQKNDRQHTKVFVVGANHSRPMWTEEQHAVFLLGGDLHIMTFFKRPYAHQQIVHCLQYKSAFRRDNSVARFSGHGFGRVHYFVKLNTLRSCGPSFYALVKVMEKSSERSDHILRSSSERHMVALRPSCGADSR